MSDPNCPNTKECCPPSLFFGLSTASALAGTECAAIECCDPGIFAVIPEPVTPETPTCTALNEFGIWFEGAPVLCESGDEEFALWLEGSPFVEKSDTY